MQQLATAMRREQFLLEFLLFKLTETRLLLGAGEIRFIARSAREVEKVRERTCQADLARAALVDRATGASAPSHGTTLRQLAATAEEPWAGMLRDHHDAMGALVAEIELVAHHNAQLARDGLRQLKEPPSAPGTARVIALKQGSDDRSFSVVTDRSAYGSVLGSADGLRMPALLAFLR